MSLTSQMIAHLGQSATYLAHLIRIEEPPRELILNWATASRANVKARGGYLRKISGGEDVDNAGASSTQNWAGDVYVQCVLRMVGGAYLGLSSTNTGVAVGTMQFAMGFDTGNIVVYESGSPVATSPVAPRAGDTIRVQRASNIITYWHNRTRVYTSLVTPSGIYYAKGSLGNVNATIERAVFGFVQTVVRATDHTRRITFENELYKPLPLLPTRFDRSEGLSPNNAELTHVLMAGGVTEADLIGGRWNYARYEFITVNYLDLTMGVAQRAKGRLGEFRLNSGRFTAELRSLSQPMSQNIGGVVGALCSARRLGNYECGQPMDNYIHDTAITTVTDSLTLTVNLSPAKANGYFQQGSIYFRGGGNQFYEREIKNNVGNVITLARPFPFLSTAANLVTLTAGCVRLRSACKTFVNLDNPSATNVENFAGGFPDVPGNSQLYRFPE
jgi:uncharacterized phage protein (TIGR02218 family)